MTCKTESNSSQGKCWCQATSTLSRCVTIKIYIITLELLLEWCMQGYFKPTVGWGSKLLYKSALGHCVLFLPTSNAPSNQETNVLIKNVNYMQKKHNTTHKSENKHCNNNKRLFFFTDQRNLMLKTTTEGPITRWKNVFMIRHIYIYTPEYVCTSKENT